MFLLGDWKGEIGSAVAVDGGFKREVEEGFLLRRWLGVCNEGE